MRVKGVDALCLHRVRCESLPISSINENIYIMIIWVITLCFMMEEYTESDRYVFVFLFVLLGCLEYISEYCFFTVILKNIY